MKQRLQHMDPHLRTYPDIGHKALGNTGRFVVSIVINIELYLLGTGFLILKGDTLHKIFPNFCLHLLGLEFRGKQVFVILVALILLPSVWLDNMTILSYVFASGVLASGVILIYVIWVGPFERVIFEDKGFGIINWHGIATSVSLYTLSYCAHAVFPTLYTSKKNKRQFPDVMLICFTLCTITYASMAVFGYLIFGSQIQSQITLDLPIQKFSSKAAIYTALVNPVAKYALMVTPIINAMRSRFSGFCGCEKRNAGVFLGTTLVISNVIVALLLPFFGYLVTFIGAFLSIAVSVILPCLCYLKISGNYRRFGFHTLILIGIILVGIIVMIIRAYQSVLDIITQL